MQFFGYRQVRNDQGASVRGLQVCRDILSFIHRRVHSCAKRAEQWNPKVAYSTFSVEGGENYLSHSGPAGGWMASQQWGGPGRGDMGGGGW